VLYHIEQLNSTALRLERDLHEFASPAIRHLILFIKKELLTAAHHAGMLAQLVGDNPAQLSGLTCASAGVAKKWIVIKKVIAAGTVSATAPRTLIPSEENTRLTTFSRA